MPGKAKGSRCKAGVDGNITLEPAGGTGRREWWKSPRSGKGRRWVNQGKEGCCRRLCGNRRLTEKEDSENQLEKEGGPRTRAY